MQCTYNHLFKYILTFDRKSLILIFRISLAMKKYTFVLLVFIFCSVSAFSQSSSSDRIIAFHPSSGKSIDVQQKNRYNIFNEYSDSVFELAQLVKHKDSSYSILIKTRSGKSIEKAISIAELDNIYSAIDKVEKKQPGTDLYSIEPRVENELSEERRIRERRVENAIIIGNIAYRSFIVLIEILAVIAQAAY